MSTKLLNVPVDFKIKSSEEGADSVTIEGFANTTTVDRMGDIILEEAWTKGGLENYLKNPIILAYHNHERPIGKMTDYAVNNKGLKITADISSDTGEVFSLINSGVLKTFSVGFRLKEADYDTETDIFVIKDLELMEVSVVSVPANADSVFSVKKSFDKDEDYNSFKAEFSGKDVSTVIAEDVSIEDSDNLEENQMSEIDKKELEKELRAKIEKEAEDKAALEKAIQTTVSDEVGTAAESIKADTVEVVKENVESLREEITKSLEDKDVSIKEALESIQNDIKEYAEELTAIKNSKITFSNKGVTDDGLTIEEKDTAILVSKILNKPIDETKYGKGIIEKSNQEHLGSTSVQDWETDFTTRLFDDIRERLIVEPMFRSIQLPTVTLNMPLNPEAGYGTWVTNAQLNAATSSGTARIHAPTDTSITAHKLATKELLGYEEEDDSLIALVPLIRDAAVRRMAKSSDKALLVGDNGVSAGSGEGTYPFDGLATIGIDDTRTVQIAGTLASPTAVTVANLQAMRRQMGVHGHSPADVVYVVNHDVYFDLLEDGDFRTMDKVGEKATILTGQVGQIAGSPVIVSGEFPAAAADNAAGICVNMSNYLKGDYKALRVERERSVENQTNLLVVTRRYGMIEIFPANPTVVTLTNPSS